MWTRLMTFSFGRLLAWVAATATYGAVKTWILNHWAITWTFASGLAYNLFPSLWSKAYEEITPIVEEAAQVASGPAAKMASNMTGLPFSAEAMASIVGDGWTDKERQAVGESFLGIFDDIFRVKPIADGYEARQPGGAERASFARFIGRNAQLQSAGIMLDLIKDKMPKDLLLGLGDMVDRGEKIMGFEDSQEEIMEPFMEKMIVEGLGKQFNRAIRPVDLTPGDAIESYIRGYVELPTMDLILDNEGIRKDIRTTLINLKAKNLTEADFRDLYQRGIWTSDQVKEGYIGNGYLEADALRKAAMLVLDREWTLKKELLNVKESQFVHGVLDEAGLRAYCASIHFTNQEEDIEIEIAKGKASLSTTKKPKQIAGTFNVAPWRVKPGASAVMSWNIRNANDITISGIGPVDNRGERVIQPTVSQTYVLSAANETDEERFEAVVQVGDTRELKRPTASFSASPGRVQVGTPVELKWSTSNADSVSIDQVGPVAEAGAVVVYPFLTTIYTLRARNAQGERIVQDVVFVDIPSIPDLERLQPSVSFTITPLVFTKAQPRVEVKWVTQRALGVTLEDNLGNTRDVGRNGVLIAEPGETGVWTLRASNTYGTTVRQEAAIRKQPEEDEPPPPPGSVPPVLSLSASPATANPGESIFVSWSITDAPFGTLFLPDGTSRQVNTSGSQSYTAPTEEQTVIFRLDAVNAAGPSTLSVTVVVSTAG